VKQLPIAPVVVKLVDGLARQQAGDGMIHPAEDVVPWRWYPAGLQLRGEGTPLYVSSR